MMRTIAILLALACMSAAQAMPRAPLQQSDEMITKVRHACGPGMHMVGGACVRTHARRAASRCARGVTC
jgi:hypothetical protein